jgi:chromosome segregation ATPase
MNKDTPITFEELFRLLTERDRLVQQKEDATNKIQKLTADIELTRHQLERHTANIGTVEGKIRDIGAALGRKSA